MRYEGTDSALVVDFGDGTTATLAAAFEAAYRRRFAFLMRRPGADGRGGVRGGRRPPATRPPSRDVALLPPDARAGGRDGAHVQRGAVAGTRRLVVRETLRPGHAVDGPAIIAEKNATTVVEPGWQARVTDLDHLLLQRVAPRGATRRARHRRPTR